MLALLNLTLRLELGPEYDTNANRSEVVAGAVNADPPVQSALTRTTARLGVVYKTRRNLVKAQVGFGSKVFFNPKVFDQDVVVGQGSLEDHVTLDRKSQLTLHGDYYDAYQHLVPSTCTDCLRRRDFRTGQGGVRLTAFDGPGTFWIGGAYRGFQYKPDAYFDFQSPVGEVGAAVSERLGTDDAPHDLTLSASYRVERRFYSGVQQLRSDMPQCAPDLPLADGCLVDGTKKRADWFHEAGVELTYVGVLLASLGYAIQLDQSNSFGQSLLRHIVTLKLAYRLPWQLYATAKLQLLVSDGLDRVVLDTQVSNLTFATIEDENRNAVILDLERDIPLKGARHGGQRLSIDARYSFFASTLGAQQTSYRRHLAYLGLTYRFGTR